LYDDFIDRIELVDADAGLGSVQQWFPAVTWVIEVNRNFPTVQAGGYFHT